MQPRLRGSPTVLLFEAVFFMSNAGFARNSKIFFYSSEITLNYEIREIRERV